MMYAVSEIGILYYQVVEGKEGKGRGREGKGNKQQRAILMDDQPPSRGIHQPLVYYHNGRPAYLTVC